LDFITVSIAQTETGWKPQFFFLNEVGSFVAHKHGEESVFGRRSGVFDMPISAMIEEGDYRLFTIGTLLKIKISDIVDQKSGLE